jgi:hypothetical protein
MFVPKLKVLLIASNGPDAAPSSNTLRPNVPTRRSSGDLVCIGDPGLLRTRRFFCGPDLVDHLHKLFERQCRQSANLKAAVDSGQNAPAKQVLNGVLIRHLYD